VATHHDEPIESRAIGDPEQAVGGIDADTQIVAGGSGSFAAA
jgi:hypothetical protein